ncbi:TPR repeat, SEL1 subfamily [hydrothermal vent metagenome]|uniref:TPR repeat, SEL1 subfamily n=1 Tax=hydrothermal vent metagenome TaxID=652676 RepID=A0A3B0TY21_9ZZZZ
MKPGVPWSVKGIEPQARETAKDAAHKAGLTLGQWLNQTILEQERDRSGSKPAKGSSSGKSAAAKTASRKTSPKTARKPVSSKPKSRRLTQGSDGVDARLEELSRKLDRLVAPAQFQAEPPQPEPETQPLLRTDDLIGHMKLAEHKTDTAIKAIRQDMTRIAEHIDRHPPAVGAGLPALEKSLADMVDHIELTDRHNSDVLRTIQARLSDLSGRMDEQGSGADRDAIAAIEHRLGSIVARLEDTDQIPGGKTYQALEAQISVLNDHMRKSEDPNRSSPAVATLEARLSQFADRLSATEQSIPDRAEFDTLKARLSALQNDMTKIPAPIFPSAVQVLETRLGTLAGEIDALRDSSVNPTRIDDIGNHLEELQNRMRRTEQGLGNAPDLKTVEARFDEVQQRIRATEQGLAKCADTEKLERRLTELSQRLENSLANERTDPAVAQIEARIDDIVRRLDQGESDLDGSVFKGLESQINRIGARLDQAEERFDTPIQSIQANLSQLYESLESSRSTTIQAAEQAAVAAAQKILANSSGAGTNTDAAEAIAALEHSLTEIKSQSGVTDRQTQETLEAVHDTLERVIERLTKLEGAGADKTGAPSALPAAFAPFEENAYDDFRLPPLPDVPPMESAAPEPGSKIASDGATDDGAPGDGTDKTARLAATPLAAGGDDGAAEPEFARAYDDSESGFSRNGDFIAAARRAAQAAAHEENAKDGGTSSEKNQPALIPIGKSKKRTLLYAVAALFLAVGALSVSGILAPGDNSGSNSPTTTGSIPEADDGQSEITTPKAFSYVPDLTGLQNAPGLQLDTGGKGLIIEMVTPAAVTPHFAPTGLGQEDSGQFASTSPIAEQSGPAPEIMLAPSKSTAFAPVKAKGPGSKPVKPAAKSATAPIFELPPAAIGSEALRNAAAAGNAAAQFVVGANFADGRAGPANNAGAAIWYQRAAAQGHPPAQYRLGTLYEKGRGVEKDINTARTWYERAAASGNRKAMHNLAVLLAGTSLGQPDFSRAARWFLKAAEMGLADSQFNLGILHERGLGVQADPAKAYKWFRIAAAAGDTDAQTRGVRLESALPAGILARTRAEVAAWRPKAPDPAANAVTSAPSKWAGGAATPAAAASATGDQGQLYIARVQRLLIELGYDPGPNDGLDGPKTRQAIKIFERERGLPVTGRAIIGVVKALEAATG